MASVETRRHVGLALILVAATIAIYAQTFGFGFVSWDASVYVTKNEMVAGGITREGVVWAFTEVGLINWHPITGPSRQPLPRR